jgi:anti-sigma-K factor RskA
MTCAEFKELVAAYAIGGLEPEELAACEAHLASGVAHEGCAEALADARAVADALLASPTPVRPPKDLWAAIEAEVRRTSQDVTGAGAPKAAQTDGAGVRDAREKPGLRTALPWLVAALLLLALFFTGWSRWELAGKLREAREGLETAKEDTARLASETETRRRCQQDLEAMKNELVLRRDAVAMLHSPSARVVALASQPGAPSGLLATALVDMGQKRGMLVVGGMAPQPGKDYELWVIKGTEKKAAGLLRGNGEMIALIDPKLLAAGADAIAITLEPAGGGPAPRGPAVMVAAMPKT